MGIRSAISLMREAIREGSYQWAFEVPFLSVHVGRSTSNMTHEWSVLAPARPARKHAERTKMSSDEHCSSGTCGNQR